MEDNKPEPANTPAKPHNKQTEAAVEIIRKKVEAAYGHEPALEVEAKKVAAKAAVPLSVHQNYAQELMQSGRPLNEIHSAWHEYYSNLDDDEKHQVWREFYAAHGHADHYDSYIESAAAKAESKTKPKLVLDKARRNRHVEKIREHLATRAAPARPKSHARRGLHSLAVGLGAGAIAVFIVLFSFFNECFIAPFVQPSRALTNAPLISDAAVGPNPELIVPKINLEIPVVYNVNTIDETAIENALESGVVHYADTPMPGQNGNLVIVGHSSNNIFNPGKYKFAFVLLNRLDTGDTFYLEKDGKRYTYQVYKKAIVDPTNVSVLGPADKPATASLITCDPPGTSLHRLVVTAEQISPDPSSNSAAPSSEKLSSQTQIIPGNAPTLWSRFWNWFSR